MNIKLEKVLKSCFYSISSNFISMSVIALITFILPNFIEKKEYGYWQLYIFYGKYINFFHLGWIEGAYLKYCGRTCEELKNKFFSTQIFLLSLMEIVFIIIIYIISVKCIIDANKLYISYMFSLTLFFVVVKNFLSYILLSINRINKYAKLILYERCLLILCIVVFYLNSNIEYKTLIFSDVIAKVFIFILAIYYCRDLIFTKIFISKDSVAEIIDNIYIGNKLMLADFFGLFSFGIIRFYIEKYWGIIEFGNVSIALGVSNLFIVFGGAINFVIFPLLRKIKMCDLSVLYQSFNCVLSYFGLIFLFLYYPLSFLLGKWIPTYEKSFIYMGILFPLCVYEVKWTILVYPYFKRLRKENIVLWVNILLFLFSSILGFCVNSYTNNLIYVIAVIPLTSMVKILISEIILNLYLTLKFKNNSIAVSFTNFLFVVSIYSIGMFYSMFTCAIFLLILLFYKKNDIRLEVKHIRNKIQDI